MRHSAEAWSGKTSEVPLFPILTGLRLCEILECDVRDLVNVKDETKFYSFMVACAARTGLLLYP